MSNARTLANFPASSLISTVTTQNNRNGYVPAGVVLPFAGATAPAGWLLCNGQAVSRTAYSALYEVISSTYGAGDGSTTFNLPDLGGRVPAGKESTATRLTPTVSGVNGAVLGSTGGAQSHTLDTTQIPAHTHNVGATISGRNTSAGGGETIVYSGSSYTSSSTGGGAAHNNTQPTIVLNYIIKT